MDAQTAGAPVVVVSTNFTAEQQTVNLAGSAGGSGKLHTLLKSPGEAEPVSLAHIELAPFGVYIGQIR